MHIYRILMAMTTILSFNVWADVPVAGNASAHSLGLRAAIQTTLAHNPQLTAFQFRHEALQGERLTADLSPAWHLATEAENVAGSGDYQGTRNAEYTLALSSVIELGGKRDARLQTVTGKEQELAAVQRIATLDVLAETTRRFIDVAAAQQRLVLQQAATAVATETLATLQRRVAAGVTSEAERARAEAALAQIIIDQRQAELELEAARVRLVAMWAATEPDFDSVEADLLTVNSIRPLKSLINELANNPDMLLLASAVRLREAELQLARSDSSLDVEWHAGVRSLQASNDTALVVGVSIPLFSGNRASGALATAQANQRTAASERDATLIQLRAEIFGLYQQHQHALLEVAALRDKVIPLLKQAVNSSRAAFDKGRYGYLELSLAQSELRDAELALVAAASRSHKLQAEIERLSGNTLTVPNAPEANLPESNTQVKS